MSNTTVNISVHINRLRKAGFNEVRTTDISIETVTTIPVRFRNQRGKRFNIYSSSVSFASSDDTERISIKPINFITGKKQLGKIVDRTIREYLPFLATENIMMEAVKRGGDRQELHERIWQHSMAATARMKEGERCDLLDRLAADPAFGMTRAELDAVMDPALYTGRCAQQVERFLSECAPLLADAQSADGAISL